MIRHDVVQGTSEWMRLRMGIPTASNFEKIVTPTGKASKQAEGYMYELLAEILLGRPLEVPKMPWMIRGSSLEADAALWYGLQRDVDPEVVGFCTTDDGRIGASPDRLIGADGLLELKAPSPQQHLQYILYPDKGVDKAYAPQVQGQLYVTGRAWCDVVSFHPELPSVIVRVARDEEYIVLLDAALNTFCDQLQLGKQELERRGLFREEEPQFDPLGISDADLEAILAARREDIVAQ